jgi:hypothetical protein
MTQTTEFACIIMQCLLSFFALDKFQNIIYKTLKKFSLGVKN